MSNQDSRFGYLRQKIDAKEAAAQSQLDQFRTAQADFRDEANEKLRNVILPCLEQEAADAKAHAFHAVAELKFATILSGEGSGTSYAREATLSIGPRNGKITGVLSFESNEMGQFIVRVQPTEGQLMQKTVPVKNTTHIVIGEFVNDLISRSFRS
jgi:hypothetical protein